MTAAFMWPGAEEPIGEWRGSTLSIEHAACRRQGIDPEVVREHVVGEMAGRLANGMLSRGVASGVVSIGGKTATFVTTAAVELSLGNDCIVTAAPISKGATP